MLSITLFCKSTRTLQEYTFHFHQAPLIFPGRQATQNREKANGQALGESRKTHRQIRGHIRHCNPRKKTRDQRGPSKGGENQENTHT